jgi:hypothetical protein
VAFSHITGSPLPAGRVDFVSVVSEYGSSENALAGILQQGMVSGARSGSLGVGSLDFRAGFNADATNAVPIHLENRKTAAIVLDGFSTVRNAAEAREQESGKGFYAAFAGKAPAHLSFEIAEIDAAVEDEASGGGGEDLFGNVEFVFDLADELLDGVFDSDKTDGGSEFVDDDGEMTAPRLELVQEVEDGFGFGHNKDFAHDLFEAQLDNGLAAEARFGRGTEVHEARDVFGVDKTNDEFGAKRGVVDGNAGVLLIDDAGAGVFDQHVEGEGKDALARGHDFARGNLVDFDGAVNEGFLILGKHSSSARSGGHELELFGRVDGGFMRKRRTEGAQNKPRGAVHEADGGACEADEDIHWPSDGDGNLLGFAEGQRLGDKLSEQHLEIGDEGEGYRDGDEMRIDVSVRNVPEPDFEQVSNDRLADPAEGEAAEGDAELHGGEEIVKVLLQMADKTRSGTALRDHLLDACLANADEGELSGDEKAVAQDQHHNGYATKEQEFGH